MFEVRITAPELAEALNNLAAAIAGRTGEALPVTTVRTDTDVQLPEKPKTAARSAAKPSPKTEPSTLATEEAQQEPTPGATDQAPESEASASDKDDAGAVDYAAVKKAVMDVSVKKGRVAAVALLAEFDVPEGQKADQIDETRWGEFVARAAEVLGE